MNATNQTETPEQVGRRIGRKIARDVIRQHLRRKWTGLDVDDAAMVPAGFGPEERERVVLAAKSAYVGVIRDDRGDGPGFFGTDAHTYYLAPDGSAYVVQGDEASERPWAIDADRLPYHAARCDRLVRPAEALGHLARIADEFGRDYRVTEASDRA